MRWIIGLLLFVSASALVSRDALAAGYATDEAGGLYRVLPDEKKVERLGTVRVTEKRGAKSVTSTPSLTDLANSDLHGLYGISFTHLYKVNMLDPDKSQRIGPLGAASAQFNALAFDDKGRLFALEYENLYEVDLLTGKTKALGSLGASYASDGDLAFVGGVLYASMNVRARCHLVRIDPKTWKATDLGVFRAAPPKGSGDKQKKVARKPRTYDDIWGLIWDGRSLFALTPQGEVLEVDIKTAVVKTRYRVSATFYGACPMLRI